jgi:hypothetical protein
MDGAFDSAEVFQKAQHGLRKPVEPEARLGGVHVGAEQIGARFEPETYGKRAGDDRVEAEWLPTIPPICAAAVGSRSPP